MNVKSSIVLIIPLFSLSIDINEIGLFNSFIYHLTWSNFAEFQLKINGQTRCSRDTVLDAP